MLNLKVNLEEDIFIDTDINENEINISIKETKEELADIFNSISIHTEIISNLIFIRSHINKFGITKEFLHLVNSDGNLSASLGITLPSCEEENIDQINEEEIPEAEIFVEAIGDLADKTKNGLIKAYKWLKEKIIKFYNWVKNLFGVKEKQLKQTLEDIDPENIAKEANVTSSDVNEAIHQINSNPLEVTFIDKKTFDAWIDKTKKFNRILSSVKFDPITFELHDEESIFKEINEIFPTTKNNVNTINKGYYKKDSSDTNKGYLPTSNIFNISFIINNNIKNSTLLMLHFGKMEDFEKEGFKLIDLIKEQLRNTDMFISKLKTLLDSMDKQSRHLWDKKQESGLSEEESLWWGKIGYGEAVIRNLLSIFHAIAEENTRLINLYRRICLHYKKEIIHQVMTEYTTKYKQQY